MSVINKRQQARNERALQDLIKSVPGNDKCADCGARNPGWASWNLGVFLCVRCASLHRKLGTHVSKVKSLSMDTWSSDQVDNMKRVGNNASNKIFNPRNAKPSIPIDIDEVDGVMERYIRQKYDTKTLSTSQPGSAQHTGSSSSGDRTPELPPKPSKRFTFALRSATTFPKSRAERTMSPPISPEIDFPKRSPQRKTKPSKIFGTDIGGSRQDNYELKLIALRDMGFPDDKRNLTILKGENGNVDRAVATLIRLGEGAKMSSGESSPTAEFGPETPPKDNPAQTKPNPFDRLDLNEKALPPPPVEELSPKPSFTPGGANSWNPFLQQSQPTLEQSFQGLQVSQPSNLFPNTTGGYITPHQSPSTNPFLQTYTPPPATHMVGGPVGAYGQQNYAQTGMTPLQPAITGTNPFLSQSQPMPQMVNTNPFGVPQNAFAPQQQMVPTPTGNPFNQMQSTMSNTYPAPAQQMSLNPFNTHQQQHQQQHQLQHQQQQQHQHQHYQQQQPQMQAQTYNPFQTVYSNPTAIASLPHLTQTPPTQSPIQQFGSNPFFSSFQHSSQSVPIPGPAKVDKASILALYNTPQLAPQQTQSQNYGLPTPVSAVDEQPFGQQHFGHQPKRSVTMPLPTGFSQHLTPISQQQTAGNNMMMRPHHESIDFVASGLLNGRHSPDIFSGLSARIGR